MPKHIFSESDYNSSDGMMTSIWGPSYWHILHTMSFNYPIKPTCDDKKNYRNLILNLKNVLPCKYFPNCTDPSHKLNPPFSKRPLKYPASCL